MSTPNVADDLDLAQHLADVAAEITLRHFAPSVATEKKVDGSPVTEADLAVDAAICEILHAERPQDSVLSEESGDSGPMGAQRRWIIDPLDATIFFASGGRGWGTYVALEAYGEIILGVINHPADERRYWGVANQGAYAAGTNRGIVGTQPRRVEVSTTDRLADARVMAWPPTQTPAFERFAATTQLVEATPDFIVDLIEGRIDVLLSQGGEVWDHAAEVAIVQAAGGRFRDPTGGKRLDLKGGTYTNERLEHQVLSLLGRS